MPGTVSRMATRKGWIRRSSDIELTGGDLEWLANADAGSSAVPARRLHEPSSAPSCPHSVGYKRQFVQPRPSSRG